MPALFFAETGWYRPIMWTHNFTTEFRSYSPGQENSEKNSKKIQKIVKLLPGIIFSQYGMRLPEKVKTKFYSRIPFMLDPSKKIPKKIVRKFKKLLNLFPALFLAKTGWDKTKKWKQNFTPEFGSYSTRARKFRKKQ